MILAERLAYDLVLVLPDGDTLSLRPALLGLSYEEQPNELSVRLQAKLSNQSTARGRVHQLVALGSKVVALADWGEGFREVFRGTVFGWTFDDAGASVEITCYDDLFWLTRSEDHYLFAEGSTGADRLRRLFQDWGVPTGVIEGPIAPLPKGKYQGSLADTVFTILTESFYEEGQEYVIRTRENVVGVVQPGRNEPVYHLSAARDVENFSDQQSITELVTEVRIVGEESDSLAIADDGEGSPAAVRPAIDRVLVSDDPIASQFGRFRALIMGQENDNPADLEAKANAIFSERGAPQRTRSLTAPDLPFLRRGDRIRVTAGTMDEYALVTGVQHDADARKMQLTIDSSGTFKHRQKKIAKVKAVMLADDPA